MSTELSNGVIIPEEYSDDWYDEMSINLRKLNDVITAASDNATDIQRLDTDKANQSDLTALTSRVSQNETDIIALQTAVSGALKREIVQTLPTEDISTTTIYMIRNSQSSGTNIYDEYMYINSQWELIGTSATDFSNYYTKNETDNLLSGKVDNSTLGSYYTKTESDNLLSAKANQTDLTSLSGRVTQTETDITALQTAVSGALKREIVQTLPTQDISTTTIYMIRNTTTSGDNIYDEYMYINNLWELIGTSATDFSNYYTKTEIDTLLSGKANDNSVVHTNEINSSGIGIIEAVKEMGGVDFNTLTTQGVYGTNASGSTNNPENSPCVVQVIKRLNSVIQIANVSSSAYKSRYIRYCADITAQPPVWQSWIKFATDDSVMHLSENETAAGKKTFSDMSSFQGSYLGNEASANARSDLILESNRDTHGQSGIFLTKFRQNKAQGSMSGNDVAYLSYDCLENSVRTNNGLRINFLNFVDDIPQRFILWSGITERLLGVPNFPWSDVSTNKINSLNPGALSLPDLSNGIDISSYITVVANANKESLYTPPVNGWISVALTRTSGINMAVMLKQGSFASSGHNITQENGTTTCNAMLPVKGGVQVSINSALADGIDFAYFYPCQGNI